MMTVYVEGVGVLGPGLSGWESAAAVLSQRTPYVPAEVPRLMPALLPADVRRRTTEHIRLAIEVATQAVAHAGEDAAGLSSVFASSESDGGITHNICEEVAKEKPEVSPTRFHNSVNNAPAGYWSMAAGSRQPSTSVAGFDATFAVGLVEACAQVLSETRHMLLVAHDTPLPEPLNSVRTLHASFGVGLVLRASPSARCLARLEVAITPDAHGAARVADPQLEALRLANPAARVLPLLAVLASGIAETVILPYVGDLGVRVLVEPCA